MGVLTVWFYIERTIHLSQTPLSMPTFITRSRIKWLLTDIILTWQAIAWTGLIIAAFFIVFKVVDINSLKAGSFEITFADKAKNLGVFYTPEFKNLNNLDEDELKLFLIVGGKDAAYYIFQDRGVPAGVFKDRYMKLVSDSLFRITKVTTTNGKDSTWAGPTETGKKIHQALVQSIYSQMIK
jgi:hypothetical protein